MFEAEGIDERLKGLEWGRGPHPPIEQDSLPHCNYQACPQDFSGQDLAVDLKFK